MIAYSLGEIIDKLVIENIKIFRLREKIHDKSLPKKDRVEANQKMMELNNNRVLLMKEVDEKINSIISGKDKNKTLKIVRTYGKN